MRLRACLRRPAPTTHLFRENPKKNFRPLRLVLRIRFGFVCEQVFDLRDVEN
jgi:hypothetical protein